MNLRRGFLMVVSAAALGCGPVAVRSEAPADRLPAAEPAVTPVLLPLLDERKLERPPRPDFSPGTPLNDIVKLTTPAGYRLKTRYQELGVALAQALALCREERLKLRLVEAARWTSSPRTRSEALLALAGLGDPDHLKFFREALLDQKVDVQFAAVDALQAWGRPEAIPLLLDASQRNWSSLVRVYAAQAALRLGDGRGKERLLYMLRDQDWLVRAMAARYVGEFGGGTDADLLLARLGPERDAPFALAEVCIAALKLLAKRSPAPAPPPPPTPSRPAASARRDVFELEPLIITAPRLQVPRHMVDVRIDNELVRMLEKMAQEPEHEEVLGAAQEQLKDLATPKGFALKVRYSDLSFLLTEGLAGTSNLTLVQRLEAIARTSPNTRARAAALVALGYDPERKDLTIFVEALRESSLHVRFGAVEALAALGTPPVRPLLAGAAQSDASKVVRVFAAQALARLGDPYGRQVLLQFQNDFEWPLRAMSIYFLGEVGQKDDYYSILNQLNRETEDFVRAEACLALLKLASTERR